MRTLCRPCTASLRTTAGQRIVVLSTPYGELPPLPPPCTPPWKDVLVRVPKPLSGRSSIEHRGSERADLTEGAIFTGATWGEETVRATLALVDDLSDAAFHLIKANFHLLQGTRNMVVRVDWVLGHASGIGNKTALVWASERQEHRSNPNFPVPLARHNP
ncbi:hypothetical protein HPB47_009673 [Ixodes persulcatus]|uniref:Uncharacterized protein n=1 Tax=Ixodes persulcatus TaxID=34615 RepID=A0AC60P189_IXOPE|nr:hypothetical protein HPB47_009673 [Ixodes persulcatus]